MLTVIHEMMIQYFMEQQSGCSKFLFYISTAKVDSGGIPGTPAGQGASAILSALIYSTNSLRWMTTVCFSSSNTQKGPSTACSKFGV